MSKIATYIGFAVKARKLIVGANLLYTCKKKIYVLIVCSSASDNTKKDAKTLAFKHKTHLVEVRDMLLEDIVNKTNTKLIGLLDENLAKAILDNLDQSFILINTETEKTEKAIDASAPKKIKGRICIKK